MLIRIRLLTGDSCDIVQVILLLFGMEFLWRKSGELMGHYGYGSDYEVIEHSLALDQHSCTVVFLNWLGSKGRYGSCVGGR